MARGNVAPIGSRFTNKNGYTYEKTENGWEPIHQLLAERQLGRPLAPDERARFKDGDRTNHDPSNIEVVKKLDRRSPQAKILHLDVQIKDLKDKLEDLQEQRAALQKLIS